ncbi:RNA-guided endonuclease TnpB family protein [Allocoleopsis franciscana]|uniref:RNA-guided endonuclease TnpB family protein n=1 Tax=Allocoleopsis franciscana TaxID=2886352 RepID=UPI00031ED615|nr:RNA-guided endonuclease TnpB family protein [Allocoleopsis franciscana]
MKTYVLEDLSGIRNQRRNKKVNKWISSWSFYQLEQFLTYKAEAKGRQVGYVDARYTSQKCSRCKQRHSTNRHKSRFHCKTCGFKAHADINAATNIKDDYILSTTQA